MTLTWKNLSQSSSGISRNGFASKIPTLLTRMSASGTSSMKRLRPAAFDRSPGMQVTCAPGTSVVSRAAASRVRSSVLPLTTTAAPASASPLAIA